MKKQIKIISVLLIFTVAMKVNGQDTIYIIQQAWHTGIIIKTSSFSTQIFPEIINYQHLNYVDFGWGDEKYYQSEGVHIGLAARAVLFPTSSVIRVIGFHRPVDKLYKNSRIETIVMDSANFNSLCHFIAESFIRDNEGSIMPSTYSDTSKVFFRSCRKYHLFRTCNTWVALALKESDIDVRSFMILNANQLFRQLKMLED